MSIEVGDGQRGSGIDHGWRGRIDATDGRSGHREMVRGLPGFTALCL
jgi:hypothetical protein